MTNADAPYWRIEYEDPTEGWTSYAFAYSDQAARIVLAEMRAVPGAVPWAAVRVEHSETVEEW
jgi:hypothetical protein